MVYDLASRPQNTSQIDLCSTVTCSTHSNSSPELYLVLIVNFFISVDAIFDQLNTVNETLTSDFETLHNDMDAMELKHEQAIGKSNSKFKKQMVFCLNNSCDILIHVF